MTIYATHAWPTNAHLIEACAQLGYLHKDWFTLDPTYGRGRWWVRWKPDELTHHDLAPNGIDFRRLPYPADHFDAVVLDPPYKLNGTPALGDFDNAYGVDVPRTWQERYRLIEDGITECVRVLKPGGTLLLKCQDQVCSGKVRWQTFDFTKHAGGLGLRLVDRLDMVTSPRPQPEGRHQVHARRNTSSLLVFRVG